MDVHEEFAVLAQETSEAAGKIQASAEEYVEGLQDVIALLQSDVDAARELLKSWS